MTAREFDPDATAKMLAEDQADRLNWKSEAEKVDPELLRTEIARVCFALCSRGKWS